MLYTVIALQIADERSREADRIRLAHQFRAGAAGSPELPRPGRGTGLRAAVARPVRALGSAAGAFADAACSAASRIEGAAG
jgi:hypothetical protein